MTNFASKTVEGQAIFQLLIHLTLRTTIQGAISKFPATPFNNKDEQEIFIFSSGVRSKPSSINLS